MSQDAENSTALVIVRPKVNHVLIDHENVQPLSLKVLNRDDVRVLLFIGASQTKLSSELAISGHALGDRMRYVQVSAHGNNALDFHIAYYLGKLCHEQPGDYLHVVSKDTGFDPLLAHLRSQGCKAYRVSSIESLAFLPKAKSPMQPASTVVACASAPSSKSLMNQQARLAHMRENLSKNKNARPAKQETLVNHIQAQFQKQINKEQAQEIVAGLRKSGFLRMEGQKVFYL